MYSIDLKKSNETLYNYKMKQYAFFLKLLANNVDRYQEN